MSDRSLLSVADECRENFIDFEQRIQLAGIQIVRACVYRSNAEQALLYAQGRTAPGRIVTWAQPGQSPHNRTRAGRPASHAADYYPLVHDKLANRSNPYHNELWHRLGECAALSGLHWGGLWPAPKTDFPHFEFRP